MNIKLKALLIALSIPIGMALFVYALVFYTGYLVLLLLIGLVFGLYKLILHDLEEIEKRKKR